MTISQIFKVLESKGYIFRAKHPKDVRAKIVGMTEKGNMLMHKAFNTIWDVDKKFFKVLGSNTCRINKYLNELLMTNTNE